MDQKLLIFFEIFTTTLRFNHFHCPSRRPLIIYIKGRLGRGTGLDEVGGLPSWENEMKAFFRSLYCSILPAHGTQISDIIDPNLFCINHDSELNWIYLVNQFNYCTVEKLGTLSIFIADLSMLMSSWTNLHPNEFEVLGPDSSAGLQDSDRDSASPRNPPEHWGWLWCCCGCGWKVGGF